MINYIPLINRSFQASEETNGISSVLTRGEADQFIEKVMLITSLSSAVQHLSYVIQFQNNFKKKNKQEPSADWWFQMIGKMLVKSRQKGLRTFKHVSYVFKPPIKNLKKPQL